MTSSHAVSVALCTHNGAPFIEAQLTSILNQSSPVSEVVISDDASTDGTPDLVRRLWPPNAPPLRVLNNERAIGVTANFERAISSCESELIVLSDQDDLWAPDRVERTVAAFSVNPSLLLRFTDADLIGEHGERLGVTLWQSLEIASTDLADIRKGRSLEVLIRRNLATGATIALRRSLFELARPFPDTWVHDEWLAVIAASFNRIDWSDELSIGYRQHGANQIGAVKPTVGRKLSRVLQPRGTRNIALAARAADLAARLKSLSASEEAIRLGDGKAAHEAARAALPSARVRRIVPIMRALHRGDYGRYSSRRRLDVIRDLLQPER